MSVSPRTLVWMPGLVVATGAAVATAHGLFKVAVAAQVPAGIAWLYPLITDGLALVAYAATARLAGNAGRYAWAVVVGSAGLSGLAQAAYLAGGATLDAAPALRFGVGAWPAVAAALVAHLLHLLTEPTRADAGSPTSPVARRARDRPGPVAAPSVRIDRSPATADPGRVAVSSPTLPEPAPTDQAAVPVQATPYAPTLVHLALYDAVAADLAAAGADVSGPADDVRFASLDEPPAGPVEQAVRPEAAPAPRERARTAALHHASRYGALPTVTELQDLAAVSRGTAGAALKALRQRPQPLHLVPDTPDSETQP